MAATIGMALLGAVLNATAFSGGNMLAQKLSGGGVGALDEKIRHDKALETYTAARMEFDQHRAAVYDWVSEQRTHVNQTREELEITDEDLALYQSTHNRVEEVQEPFLSEYYRPSESQKKYEMVYIVGGLVVGAVGLKWLT